MRAIGTTEREAILSALSKWIKQRPGLDPANYFGSGDYRANLRNYRQEVRSITKDKRDAETLLAAVGWRTSIDAEALKQAFRAFSGRLTVQTSESINPVGLEGPHSEWTADLDYCTGQYWPTEYRKAACAVLASALWDAYRADVPNDAKPSPGDAIRKHFRQEFGRSIQSRWFN